MDTIQRTSELLRTTEASIAELAHQDMAERQYDRASILLDIAQQIKKLSSRLSTIGLDSAPGEGGTALGSSRLPNPVNGKRSGSRTAWKKAYPQFVREGDSLVKIGWSRTEKKEYEHRCPKKVLTLLFAAISQAGAGGRRFTMADVLPLTDASDGSEVPTYQVYLCVAWLRSVGIVTQYGRQGYSLAATDDLNGTAALYWRQLPTR